MHEVSFIAAIRRWLRRLPRHVWNESPFTGHFLGDDRLLRERHLLQSGHGLPSAQAPFSESMAAQQRSQGRRTPLARLRNLYALVPASNTRRSRHAASRAFALANRPRSDPKPDAQRPTPSVPAFELTVICDDVDAERDVGGTVASSPITNDAPGAKELPKTASWVWLGGEISQVDLANPVKFATLNGDYEVCIWTDNATRMSASLDKLLAATSEHADAIGKLKAGIKPWRKLFDSLAERKACDTEHAGHHRRRNDRQGPAQSRGRV